MTRINRQKVDAVLHDIKNTYQMSFAHFLWEFFRYSDAYGKPLSRSRLHKDALEDILRGHVSCYSFAHLLEQIMKDPMAYPKKNSKEDGEMFSNTVSYLDVRHAAPALSNLAMEIVQTRKLAPNTANPHPLYLAHPVSISTKQGLKLIYSPFSQQFIVRLCGCMTLVYS